MGRAGAPTTTLSAGTSRLTTEPAPVMARSPSRTGAMSIEASTLRHNPSDGFETRGFPGIFFLGAQNPTVTGSTLR